MRKLILPLILLYSFSGINAQKITEQTLKIGDGIITGELTQINKNHLVIFIAGSGPTDRNGNNTMMKNNSLKMLSDSLIKKGISTLRLDKRGVGNSKINDLKEEKVSFDTFVYDILKWYEVMAKEGFQNIYLMGHSEGSLIGIIACQKQKNIKGLISVAGAGTSADTIILNQLASLPSESISTISKYFDTLKTGNLLTNVPPSFYMLFRPSVQPYMISWIKYNPSIEISKLDIPILILQGKNDLQVSIKDAESLFKNSKKAEIHLLENTNHVLKLVSNIDDNKKSYADSSYLLNSDITGYIAHFVQRISKKK